MAETDHFADFVPAPNISSDPDLYELENAALCRNGRLDTALRRRFEFRELLAIQDYLLDTSCQTCKKKIYVRLIRGCTRYHGVPGMFLQGGKWV